MKTFAAFAALALLSVPSAALAQSEDAPPPPPPAAGAGQPRRGLTLMADAGFAYRRLYSIPIYGADVEVSVGGALRALSIYGSAGLIVGATEHGLTTTRLAFGPSLVFPVSERVRLGLQPRIGYIAIQRVTMDDSIRTLGFGLYGTVTVDVVNADPWAIYAGLRLGGENFVNSEPAAWLWGGTLSLGARY